MRLSLVLELPFPARSPLEDMHYSFYLGSRNLPMIAVPSLDRAEVPPTVRGQIGQAARWFFGPAEFRRYLRDPATRPARGRGCWPPRLRVGPGVAGCAVVPAATAFARPVGPAPVEGSPMAVVAVLPRRSCCSPTRALGAPAPWPRGSCASCAAPPPPSCSASADSRSGSPAHRRVRCRQDRTPVTPRRQRAGSPWKDRAAPARPPSARALLDDWRPARSAHVPCYADHVGGGRFLPRPSRVAARGRGAPSDTADHRDTTGSRTPAQPDATWSCMDRSVHTLLAHRYALQRVTGLALLDRASAPSPDRRLPPGRNSYYT